MARRTPAQGQLFAGDRRRSARVRTRWDTTVNLLRQTGRIEPIDEALVKLGRVTADECDGACSDPDESRFVRAHLLKTMLTVYVTLRDQSRPDVDNASLDQLLAGLLDPADAHPGD
jgi:hypothetical protein